MAPTPLDPQTTDPALHPTDADRAGSPARTRPQVELRLPAEGAYAAIVRTTAAGLAARLDFTIDEIEDLRIAIGEASALVIPQADPDADLVCRFHLSPRAMTVELETGAVDEPPVDEDSFAWQVLSTMAEDVAAGAAAGRFWARFTVTSQVAAG